VLSSNRAAFQAHLAAAGVEALIHYPIPIPRQPALRETAPADCPVANRVCEQIVSLPMYPGLSAAAVAHVVEAAATFSG
jgi:dTDP-4-amino-4,6-dideoxygalactose transaminase